MIKLTLTSLIEEFEHYFKGYGVTENQLRECYDKKQSIGDYAWEIFNKILTEIANELQKGNITLEGFYKRTGNTYQQMGYLLKLEKKDNRKIISLQFEHEVKYMELAFANLIGIKIFSYGCCDGCENYHNKILTVAEALEFAKNTEVRCQPKYDKNCRCTLIAETKEDKNSPIKLNFTFGK